MTNGAFSKAAQTRSLLVVPVHLDAHIDSKSRAAGIGSRDGPVTTISATSDHFPPATVARGHALDREAREGLRISGTSLTDRMNRPEIAARRTARRMKSARENTLPR